MDRKNTIHIHLRWPTSKGPKILSILLTLTMILVIAFYPQHKIFLFRRGELELLARPSFIPDTPNDTRKGVPADIPRHFLIEQSDACRRKGEDVEAVIYVHSTISKVQDRQETRITWGTSSPLRLAVIFMVGRAKNDHEKDIILRETQLYKDIVQGDYTDHYHLLTYKALSSLYWITRHCHHVPWTIHTDDDIIIDTFYLKQFLAELNNNSFTKGMLHCQKRTKMTVQRRGKWAVTREELSDVDYPPFCRGSFWFLPTMQVPRLLDATAHVNFLWPDDVYLTGYVTAKANISINNIGDKVTKNFRPQKLGKKLAYIQLRSKGRVEKWKEIVKHHTQTTATIEKFGVRR